ncbi:hypothetical protein J9978_16130 [Chromobacterium violaceum]|uniref:hypothetical protein n=1 Tax=Chromobacterium violaceum TaxID=536 RepID=UPI001B31D9A9|nr:hypothetical protein [Chromobacterium violaceum]MBP4051012.1 hypothetical protein [Chromobacterium violaceum]
MSLETQSEQLAPSPRFLLAGHDTIQCAYYFVAPVHSGFDFAELLIEKERLRQSKLRDPLMLEIGGMFWLLRPYGSGSGYPLVFENGYFKIECGEFNNPSFFVTDVPPLSVAESFRVRA